MIVAAASWRHCLFAGTLLVFLIAPGGSGVAAGEGGAQAAAFHEQALGQSVAGRSIASYTWNPGEEPPRLIFAGIHGDERSAGELGQRLLARWKRDPDKLKGRHVIFVPMANPDGWHKGSRQNANGVDLNRNFPDHWKPSSRGQRNYPGPRPLSEPETRVLFELVENNKPVQIISIHSCRRCGGMNNFDGPAEQLAREMSAHNGYKASSQWITETPGSFGTFAGVVRAIPTVTLEMPRAMGSEQEWLANMQAVEAAVAFKIER